MKLKFYVYMDKMANIFTKNYLSVCMCMNCILLLNKMS